MESKLDETQKDSGQPPAWLVRIWTHHGKAREMVIDVGLWLPEYPDLLKLIKDYPGIEAYPNSGCVLSDGVTPAACDLTIKPRTLEALRALTPARPGPKTHATQATVNGIELDLRSIIGRMIYTTSAANLADACRLWLADLRLERPARVRRRVRINLERAIGVRGEDLDPALRQQIMDALTEKGMECRQ